MKKINIISTALSVLLASSVVSCDLTREPKQSLSKENALRTHTDVLNWEAGLLHRLRITSMSGVYTMVQDVQADELTATKDFGNNYGSMANWTLLQADNYQARDAYAGYYKSIKDANHLIEHLPTLIASSTELTDKEKANVKVVLGEAYFARAYAYLNLALRYGKSYDEATADKELSVPLHKVYNFQAKPPRATNKEVYAFILADIAEAEKAFASAPGRANAPKPTLDAAKALKARTLLYMKRYADALQVAQELIASPQYALMAPSAENMKNYWQADGTTLKEGIYLPTVSFPEEANNALEYYLFPDAKTHTFRPYYLPSQAIYDLFEANDTRKTVYFWAGEKLKLDGLDYTDLVLVGKWRGNNAYATTADSQWGKVPQGRMRPKVFRLAEQYLIAAESAYHTGGDATKYLNDLRKSRGLVAVTSAGAELLKDIQDERQRELAFEGFRLWDLRRWGKDVVRNAPQTSVQGLGFAVKSLAEVTYKAGNDKFVWPIPDQDVKVGGLIQNPSY